MYFRFWRRLIAETKARDMFDNPAIAIVLWLSGSHQRTLCLTVLCVATKSMPYFVESARRNKKDVGAVGDTLFVLHLDRFPPQLHARSPKMGTNIWNLRYIISETMTQDSTPPRRSAVVESPYHIRALWQHSTPSLPPPTTTRNPRCTTRNSSEGTVSATNALPLSLQRPGSDFVVDVCVAIPYLKRSSEIDMTSFVYL
jgi:hypothetical protein